MRDQHIAHVFAMIEAAANTGKPCPSNEDIAFALDFSSGSSGARILGHLERAGLIRVDRILRSVRVATILATGKKTLRPTAGSIRDLVLDGRVHAVPEADSMPRVHRDPCTYCGTRADHGCNCVRLAA
jgi:hypothetical protein